MRTLQEFLDSAPKELPETAAEAVRKAYAEGNYTEEQIQLVLTEALTVPSAMLRGLIAEFGVDRKVSDEMGLLLASFAAHFSFLEVRPDPEPSRWWR